MASRQVGKKGIIMFLLLAVCILAVACAKNNGSGDSKAQIDHNGKTGEERFQEISFISVPEGFSISIFADDLGNALINYPGPNPGPRLMAFNNGILFTTIPNKGIIVALPDGNNDGKADEVKVVLEDLDGPHGIEFYGDHLYIADKEKVVRYDLDEEGYPKEDTEQILINDLESDGHWTKTIKIHNDRLYLSQGSSCNVCREDDPRRAAITQCNLEGKNCKPYATGLRNSVGMVLVENDLYATENGRDMIGANIPPEEINLIEEGKNYGWPICYGNKIHDSEFDKNQYIRNPCEDTEAPLVEMQAHSAPLGIAYYNGKKWPDDYRNSLFVGFHGSWNRPEKTGYKVVRIDLDDENPKATNFATGWLTDNEEVKGRPVDVVFDDEEDMYISDDNTGRIYRIEFNG